MPRLSNFCLIRSAVIFLAACWMLAPCWSQAAAKPRPASAKAVASKAHDANAGYVGTAACSRCHLEIANSFARASMGHSLTRISPEFLKTLPVNATQPAAYTDPKTGHLFEVHTEGGKLFQSESETGEDGKEVFRDRRELEWVIGGGENGYGALLSKEGYIFQAPLSFYTKPDKWDLSPGYENENLSFRRYLVPTCLYCHSGRPQPVAGSPGKYAPVPFTQTSVGCENCHGPGAAHVAAQREGAGKNPNATAKSEADPTIVNPARLTGQRSDDICMSCHQVGDVRVLQAGKTYQDFRPGEPLDKTFAIFQIPPSPENPPQDDHLDHYYSMSLSKCFRASAAMPAEKQLRCISCHDPHFEPTRAEAPAYFNGKCMACHTSQSCTAPQAARQATTPADNCVGCHMPQREIRIISHSSATNHRIVTSLDEPFPDVTFAQTTPAMPDLIHINAAGVRGPKAATPPALIRLQAYAGLKADKPEFEAAWRKVLVELETSAPGNAMVQAALGHRDLADSKVPQAIAHLERAIRMDPTQTEAYFDLSEAQTQNGQLEEAVASARKGAQLAPFVVLYRRTLIYRLISAKHYPEAEAEMEKYLQIFPADDFMRKMLTMAKQP